MWLIHAETFQLRFAEPTEDYAILSHTWGDDEVLFQDMKDLAVAKTKKGWRKIELTCRQARAHGLTWAWVDTCCIDKTSSAELSEAINSMFRWYEMSTRCYAFLEDVLSETAWPERSGEETMGKAGLTAFGESRWFTRGWTLQELIAPWELEFFDRDWKSLGDRTRLCDEIHRITLIDRRIFGPRSSVDLPRLTHLAYVPAARKMSWASSRHTSRAEDQAYCLLGLFDVHMPLLYGEGAVKALFRLQEEISNKHNDLSLFAWSEMFHRSAWRVEGLFATSVAQFRECGNIRAPQLDIFSKNRFIIASKGLEIETVLARIGNEAIPSRNHLRDRSFWAFSLDSVVDTDGDQSPKWVAIILEKRGSRWLRALPHLLHYTDSRSIWTDTSPVATEKQSIRILTELDAGEETIELEMIRGESRLRFGSSLRNVVVSYSGVVDLVRCIEGDGAPCPSDESLWAPSVPMEEITPLLTKRVLGWAFCASFCIFGIGARRFVLIFGGRNGSHYWAGLFCEDATEVEDAGASESVLSCLSRRDWSWKQKLVELLDVLFVRYGVEGMESAPKLPRTRRFRGEDGEIHTVSVDNVERFSRGVTIILAVEVAYR